MELESQLERVQGFVEKHGVEDLESGRAWDSQQNQIEAGGLQPDLTVHQRHVEA